MKYYALAVPSLRQLHTDLELSGVELSREINGSEMFSATLPKALAYSTSGGTQMIRERGTMIIAWDGNKARSYVVKHADKSATDQDQLTIQAFGIKRSVMDGTPWDSLSGHDYVQEDPMNIARRMWEHATSFEDTINVTVDDTTSPVRVGYPEETRSFEAQGEQVEFETGPWKLNWHSSTNLGSLFDELATETPFEWREHTVFDRHSTAAPQFRIELGYPQIEPAVRNLLFVTGLNLVEPDQDTSDDNAVTTEVIVLGAGEGSKKRRGRASLEDSTLMRTPKVIEDQSLTSNRACDRRAAEILEASKSEKTWAQVRVLPSSAAPVGSYDVGDVITVKGLTVWGRHEQRSRIVSLSHEVSTDIITLGLERR